MRYVSAKVAQSIEDRAYRIYLTDALKCISGNTARINGGENMSLRYIDIINPKNEETRTAEDIIESIRIKIESMGG